MIKFEISFRGLVVVGLAALTIWGVLRLWPIILLIAAAFIFFAAVLPYVDWLVRRGLHRTVSVMLLLVAFLLVLGGLFAIMIPPHVDEFGNIRERLPEDARQLDSYLETFNIDLNLEERAAQVDWSRLVSGRLAITFGQQVAIGIGAFFTIIIITVYLLIDQPRLARFLYQFIPPGREPDADQVLRRLNRVVGGYIRGQIITSLIISLFTLVVLLVARVPNAIAFAVLAGFADLIPVVGALIAVVPPTIAALRESLAQGLAVLIALVLYQQFEDRFLVPRVYGFTLNLPPLIVLIAVLAGAQLLGLPGVLLALPAVAAARVGMDYYLERRRATAVTPQTPGQPLVS